MFKYLLFLLFINISNYGFSQKIKIENHILWKDYYVGDSLISKSQFIQLLNNYEKSADEVEKSNKYFYISLSANIVSMLSSIYGYYILNNPDTELINKFKYTSIISLSGLSAGFIFELLSKNSFENAINIYNEAH